MTRKRWWITGGQVVLPDRTEVADVAIRDGRIERIAPGGSAPAEEEALDANGAWVLPGLVDLHCDAIEKEVEPRPNTFFPMEMAFLQYERKLAAHGITTMYHSLSLGTGLSLRGENFLSDLVRLIDRMRRERGMIRHRVHLRYEISYLSGLPLAQQFLREGLVHYLSFMDHAPGIGQYKRPGAFERYVMKNQGVDLQEVGRIVEELEERRSRIDREALKALAAEAKRLGLAIASHDDDTPDQVDRSISLGANVTEFPLNLETAVYAEQKGLYVCVGAPNIVRGGSHDRNLSAIDAVKAGAAHMICSDYHPASMLQAIFMLEAQGVPLPEAVAMATLQPARALGLEGELGSLQPGKRADLLIVRKVSGHPVASRTVVQGTVVQQTKDYEFGEEF
ncbi:alpha-D-ribose 1-methylphosphonate 5-triphosphate diphosphatase [Cohnella zeiphila]|uniref:Alpha-D-ribose 1-methylphosphonate 5-triphosphate diphosphatase n=1 Tax=Cohnella zeiphila TaxID=2761120 RepID=A0A7X0SRM9_9BACL|nr:alpha-D-ribose 1-methylphosphonate 5-triphosphate diphosphatase [Cohnella zeiphila]MBB6734893.1 alpha-D-ribose 1-methylphosphonate 5-triphosphate diphosphatase [Cohnella zeiphila]